MTSSFSSFTFFSSFSVSGEALYCLPAKESASSFSVKFTCKKCFEDLLLQMGQFLFSACSQNCCRQLEQKLWLQLRDTGSLKVSEHTWQFRKLLRTELFSAIHSDVNYLSIWRLTRSVCLICVRSRDSAPCKLTVWHCGVSSASQLRYEMLKSVSLSRKWNSWYF